MNTWRDEWHSNWQVYQQADERHKRRMEDRALRFAALTIHNTWSNSYRQWREGRHPALPAAKAFYKARRRLRPNNWTQVNARNDAKSQFARALLGFPDAACLDVWMLREYPHLKDGYQQEPGSTLWQWTVWLEDIYPRQYPWTRGTIGREHAEVLRWVRTGRRPVLGAQQWLFPRAKSRRRRW